MPREFPDEFRTFVNKYITSVEQIEVLLNLYGSPQHAWTAAEMSSKLRSNASSITVRLETLARRGFGRKQSSGRYQYAAAGHAHQMIELLDHEYATRRFSVIELVFSRTSAARSFADAFRLREESDEDNG